MRKLQAFVVLSILSFAAHASAAERDICASIPASELERVQDAKLLLTKPSAHDDGRLTTSTCYYRMDPEAKSVSLAIISKSKGDSDDPRRFWKSHFSQEALEGEQSEAEAGKKHAPEKISALGEEAFWVDTGRDGALYMLLGSRIIRLSLGGREPQEQKRIEAMQLARLIGKIGS